MEQSILKSTKKLLLIGDDDSFDLDVMTHINSAFSTLTDLGVGPADGFVIEDEDAVWDDFLSSGDKVQTSQIKTFVLLRSRLGFDPPSTSYLLTSAENQVTELLARISMRRENVEWTPPPTTELYPAVDPG